MLNALLSIGSNVGTIVFVVSSMLAMGVGLTPGQILQPLRNYRLVALALLANFVAMPLIAVAISTLLGLQQPFAVGLLLLGCAAGATVNGHLVVSQGLQNRRAAEIALWNQA